MEIHRFGKLHHQKNTPAKYDVLFTYYDVSVTFILDHPVYITGVPL